MSIAAGVQVDAALATPLDEDWYRITLPGPRDLLAWTGPGIVGQIGDTQLRVYDNSNNLLADINDGPMTPFGYYSEVRLGNLPAGTYFLQVVGFLGSAGSYSLDVVLAGINTFAHAPTLAPVAEANEPNDPRRGGAATASALFTRNSGVLATSGNGTAWSLAYSGTVDYDLYAFFVPAPCQITLETGAPLSNSGPGGGIPAANDTVLHLLDASLVRLAFDDDSGKGSYSRLVYSVPAAGVYYAAVNGFLTTNTGAYILDILGPLPPLPAGAAALAESPPSCIAPGGAVHLGLRPNAFGFPDSPELPVLGSTFCLGLDHTPANSFAFTTLDFAVARTPLSGAPLAPGCLFDLGNAPLLCDIRATDAFGSCCWPLPLPLHLPANGVRLQLQALAVDLAGSTPTLWPSNRCVATCGLNHY